MDRWVNMPKTKKKSVPRIPIRIPKPMMDVVDKIVATYPALYPNRQQFVEIAIRQKIEKINEIEVTKASIQSSTE